jgi:HCOMODA/2-hydroxy-3-carboxy-muconic semialdehyde decarboxylase
MLRVRFATYIIALLLVPGLLFQSQAQTSAKPAPAQQGLDPAQVADLVLADRVLANEGLLDGYGHVSVRSSRNPNHFLLARSVPAGSVTAADILEYDLDANPVEKDAPAGFIERYIHSEIYRAHPEVMAVVHTHAPDVIPFTVTNVPLRPMIHVAGFIPQTVKVFDNRKVAGMTDLLIRTPELGRALAQALGSDSMMLLRGHGAVVVAPGLHIVVGRTYYMTIDARTELQALALGGGNVTFLAPEEAAKSADQDGFERAWTLWKAKLAEK